MIINSDVLTNYEAVGVVSDRCKNIGTSLVSGLSDVYAMSTKSGFKGTSNNFIASFDNFIAMYALEPNVPIRLELDCRARSTLTFKQKSKTIHTIFLPQRKAWYPMVNAGWIDGDHSFELL